MYMCIGTYTLMGSGGMLPQKNLVFRLSETASGAFSGTTLVNAVSPATDPLTVVDD